MGKQINYWMGYTDFIKVAQTAFDCGCVIVKYADGKTECGNNIDIICENEYNYYFLPTELNIPANTALSELRSRCHVIEAGFSYINHTKKEIIRSRIYAGTGYYDEQGAFISRPEALTNIYNKLVRIIKKIAPYTVLKDSYISTNEEDYLQKKEWVHKEYITPEYLTLKQEDYYKLK